MIRHIEHKQFGLLFNESPCISYTIKLSVYVYVYARG